MTTTTDISLSRGLAHFGLRVSPDKIPPDVRQDAVWRLVDTVGVAVAAAAMDFAEPVRSMAVASGGSAEATVLVTGERLPVQLAGFVNGSLAHGQDFDDTHSVALVHPSAVAVPAALAVAERVGADGAGLLSALLVGAEAGLRIGLAGRGELIGRGFHATSVVGPFIAALATSRLLGLDEERAAAALGIAGSYSSGLFQGMLDGTWIKRIHPGIAAQGGITAALLAERDFTGPDEVLEGRYGLYATFLHGAAVDPEVVLSGLGERWHYPETTYKPYPTGSVSHTTMGAVAELLSSGGVAADAIERIDCEVPEAVIPIMCEPRETRLNPATPYHMKFSLPYAIAILVARGNVTVADFDERTRTDARIAAIARRVFFRADPSLSTERFPGRVAITTRDGRVLRADVSAQRGGPGNPMTPDEHRRKFLGNTTPALGADRAQELLAELERGWEQADVSQIAKLATATRSS